MNFAVSVVCSLSIIIAAVIAAWRFGDIHRTFRPFIYCCWMASLNEVISIMVVLTHHSNAVNNNMYVLAESLLLLWQFRRWGLFSNAIRFYRCLQVVFVSTWFTENFILFSIFQFSTWFRILYSFILVLLSINIVNRKLVRPKGILLRDPAALICLGFIIYYTYKVLVETFWVYGLNESPIFQLKVYTILDYINLFCNLIYATAVLWMPTKHRFTLQS